MKVKTASGRCYLALQLTFFATGDGSKHVLYLVDVTLMGETETVHRRYKQFEGLHTDVSAVHNFACLDPFDHTCMLCCAAQEKVCKDEAALIASEELWPVVQARVYPAAAGETRPVHEAALQAARSGAERGAGLILD